MSKSACVTVALVAVAVAGGSWLSCGPSLRRTHQSDNAFLRCFDMDYNPGRSAEQKERCWSEWLEEHVYNQPEDKVAYAELRLEELAEGISVPGPPGPPGSFDERPRPGEEQSPEDFAVEVEPRPEPGGEPAAADAGASPLAAASADAGATGDAGADSGVADLPGGDCQRMCRNSYEPCLGACRESSAPPSCANACEKAYRACMRSCFE
ncbi:MAG: hypothetical protein R6V85_15035 [Polyangia bacterium]